MKIYPIPILSLVLLLLFAQGAPVVAQTLDPGVHADVVSSYEMMSAVDNGTAMFAFGFDIILWNNQPTNISYRPSCDPLALELSDNLEIYQPVISRDIPRLLGFCAKDAVIPDKELSPGQTTKIYRNIGIQLDLNQSTLPQGNYTFSLSTYAQDGPVDSSYNVTFVVDEHTGVVIIEDPIPQGFGSNTFTTTTTSELRVLLSVLLPVSVAIAVWLYFREHT